MSAWYSQPWKMFSSDSISIFHFQFTSVLYIAYYLFMYWESASMPKNVSMKQIGTQQSRVGLYIAYLLMPFTDPFLFFALKIFLVIRSYNVCYVTIFRRSSSLVSFWKVRLFQFRVHSNVDLDHFHYQKQRNNSLFQL